MREFFLIEHVMESEKGLKVSMQQADAADAATVAAAAAASSDRALFRFVQIPTPLITCTENCTYFHLI